MTKRRLSILLILVVIGSFLYFFCVAPVLGMYREVQQIEMVGREIQRAWENRDFGEIDRNFGEMGDSMARLEGNLTRFRYVSFIPFLNTYYQDAENGFKAAQVMFDAAREFWQDLLPYRDVLGNQDQSLKNLISVSPQLISSFDHLFSGAREALPYLGGLHWRKYPDIKIKNVSIKNIARNVTQNNQKLMDEISDLQLLVNVFPELAGAQESQSYLFLFQNDKELRPTGGFITSYALVEVDAGQVSISDAKNIYEVSTDEAYLPPPNPVVVYLKQPAWRMRDTNFSPDFKQSMETFDLYWDNLGLAPTDGIIALDTQFVAALLGKLGPVHVSDYAYDFSGFTNLPEECFEGEENFTSENVVCRLEVYAQRLGLGQSERKAVIGDLMEQMFVKIMALPNEEWWPMAQIVWDQFKQKHILAYIKNDQTQQLLEKHGMAGRIDETIQNQDYLHVNDANLAGLKSDMYLTRSVAQSYEINDQGEIIKRLKLTYENTGAFDGWLNATARNYVRVYVPLGVELLEVKGGDVQTSTFEDLGKVVFDNFLQVPPLSKNSIEFVYKLPFGYSGQDIDLLIQKQPGVAIVYQTIQLGDQKLQLELTQDQQVKINEASLRVVN